MQAVVSTDVKRKASGTIDAASADLILAPKSTTARFLEVRGLERRAATSASNIHASKGLQLAPRPLWHSYAKRQHGERIEFCRRALAIPDDSYDSVDLYNPRKPPTQIIKIHVEADEISQQFLYRTRSLLFTREVVDQPVCDLVENRESFDSYLDMIYALDDEIELSNSHSEHHDNPQIEMDTQ